MDTGQSKHRLLIIDGDPNSLRVLEVSLKKAGFSVTTASNGIQAVDAMAVAAPDLIISDTDLEGTDGFELCRQIKAKPEWAKIPFLFVSGRKSIEDKIRGLELGVDDYLTKPIYIKEIGIRVRTALQRAERERLESRRDTRTKFSGDLADIGVVDLVQTIDLNRKSGIIHITDRAGRHGAVFFRDGRVIDAEVGRLAGTEAMHRLFSWSEGHFEVEFKPIRRRDVIESPTAALLMEGMRRLDEWTRLLETLPGLDKVVEVDCRVLADQLAELPDEVNGLLRLCDGTRSLLAVIDDSDYPDLEALTLASNLFAQHILYVREPGSPPEAEPSGELAHWLEKGRPFTKQGAEAVTRKARTSSTLPGLGKNELSSFSDNESEKKARPLTGNLGRPSIDAVATQHTPDDATPQVVPTRKSNTLRNPAPPPPSAPLVPPVQSRPATVAFSGGTGKPNPPELPTPGASEAGSDAPRAAAKLSDTLRGIPIPKAIQTEDETDAAQPAPAAASPGAPPRQRDTAGERTGADVNQPPNEAQETEWGGWAKGSEPPEEAEAPVSVSIEATREASAVPPSTSSPDMPEEEEQAPSRAHLRETFVMDRMQPARQQRIVPILFFLGLLVAAALLVKQLRSGEPQKVSTSEPPAIAQAPALQADTGSSQPVAVEPVPPDASAPLAVSADAKPASRPKAVVETARTAQGPTPAVNTGAPELVERCRKLAASSRSKPAAILAACQAANQADPNAPEVMVLLAQVELDRGNALEARSWAKKAVEIKPDLADAYVFLGGAEQEAGNASEAKAAYKKYLELAPSGRYARELRAVLDSL